MSRTARATCGGVSAVPAADPLRPEHHRRADRPRSTSCSRTSATRCASTTPASCWSPPSAAAWPCCSTVPIAWAADRYNRVRHRPRRGRDLGAVLVRHRPGHRSWDARHRAVRHRHRPGASCSRPTTRCSPTTTRSRSGPGCTRSTARPRPRRQVLGRARRCRPGHACSTGGCPFIVFAIPGRRSCRARPAAARAGPRPLGAPRRWAPTPEAAAIEPSEPPSFAEAVPHGLEDREPAAHLRRPAVPRRRRSSASPRSPRSSTTRPSTSTRSQRAFVSVPGAARRSSIGLTSAPASARSSSPRARARLRVPRLGGGRRRGRSVPCSPSAPMAVASRSLRQRRHRRRARRSSGPACSPRCRWPSRPGPGRSASRWGRCSSSPGCSCSRSSAGVGDTSGSAGAWRSWRRSSSSAACDLVGRARSSTTTSQNVWTGAAARAEMLLERPRGPAQAAAASATSTCATATCRCSSASTSRSTRARSSPCSAPTAPASRRC